MKYGWQLDGILWQRLSDHSGRHEWIRTYLDDDYKDTVPRGSGVYLICVSAIDAVSGGHNAERLLKTLYNVVYVGQTEDLRRRFLEHTKGYGDVRHARRIFRRLHYWYSPIPSIERDAVEQCFLDALGPAANRRNVRARVDAPVPAGGLHHF